MSDSSPEQRVSSIAGGVVIARWIVGVAGFLGSVFCFLAQHLDAAGVCLLAAGLTFGQLANALLRH